MNGRKLLDTIAAGTGMIGRFSYPESLGTSDEFGKGAPLSFALLLEMDHEKHEDSAMKALDLSEGAVAKAKVDLKLTRDLWQQVIERVSSQYAAAN